MVRMARAGRAQRSSSVLLLLLSTGLLVPWGELQAQEDPFFLDGLVVTSSPTPRPHRAVAAHVTVLEGPELEARGLTRVSEALRGVPGLSVVQNGSYGAQTSLFTRGGESDYTLVLVDGVQVNQPGGAFDYASLSLEGVERIEVVRGGGSALYGSDAVSGVVNIITATGGTGAGVQASGLVRAGSFGRLDLGADVRGGGERAAYSFHLLRTATDGILAFNNRHENTVLRGAVRLTPDDATTARVNLRVGDREYHYPTDGSGNVVDENAFTYGDENTVGLTLERRLTDAFSLEALVAHHQTDGGTDDQPDGPADTLGSYAFTSLDHMRRTSLDLRSHLVLGPALATAGFESEAQLQRSFTESQSSFGSSSGRSRYERTNRAGYVHLAAQGRAWGLTAGGRVDDNERYGTFTSWQVGGTWQPSPSLGVRATASRSVKEPTFFETFATGFARGNPDLDPERARSWEVGLDAELPVSGMHLRTTWFDQRMDDLIQYTGTPPNPDGPNYFNLASASSRGLETTLELRRGPVRLDGSWTWLDTEVLDPGADEGPGAAFVEGEALLRRPATTWSLGAGWAPTPALRLAADLQGVGERADRDFSTFPAERVDLDSYLLLGAGVQWTARAAEGGSAGLRLGLRGRNLLDASYREVVGFAAPGRALEISAELLLGGR